jgi:putative phosphoesterase
MRPRRLTGSTTTATWRASWFGANLSNVRSARSSRTAAYGKPARPQVEREATLDLRPDGGLRLAVVADTHSRPHPSVARWIEALEVDAILHAGDVGDLDVLAQLGTLAPLLAVRGNIDERAHDLPDVLTIDVRAEGQSALKLLLMHIAVYGPKIRADAARLAAAHDAKLIVCGHSHVPFIGRDRGLTVFNPGSIGPRRLRLPIVFGLLEVAGGKLSLRHIDCETGAEWAPA